MRRQLRCVLAAGLALVGQSVCAAETPRTQPDLTEAYYARATSIFRNPPLVSESNFYGAFGAHYEGARLTVLRDFQIQTQIQISRLSDEEDDFVELLAEARFTSSPFGVETREMKDGSTFASAEVDSYSIAISVEDFESTMEQLRSLADVPSRPPPKEDDGMICLHEAGVYYESIESGKRVLFSRGACDADFADAVLPAAALLDLATNKLPSAKKNFDFAVGLFDEIVQKTTRNDE